jgi:hypothetical protein
MQLRPTWYLVLLAGDFRRLQSVVAISPVLWLLRREASSLAGHTLDDRYSTETEVDTLLSGYVPTEPLD